jgi:hypothetical protein
MARIVVLIVLVVVIIEIIAFLINLDLENENL